MWFGLLRTIHYFIIFCKIVKTGTAYAESSFLAGLRLRDLKKLGLRLCTAESECIRGSDQWKPTTAILIYYYIVHKQTFVNASHSNALTPSPFSSLIL